MEITTTTATRVRTRTGAKRRIHWGRVLTCAAIPMCLTLAVRGIAHAYTNGGNALGTNGGSLGGEELPGIGSTTVQTTSEVRRTTATVATSATTAMSTTSYTYTANATTTTWATAQTTRPAVANADRQLKLKDSASDMGIHGEYYSQKLGYYVTEREQALLLMLVLSEGAHEPHDSQVGIASTVLNRALAKGFPDDIEGVIVQPKQFTPVITSKKNGASKSGFFNNCGNTEVRWNDYSTDVHNAVYTAVYDALDGLDSTESVGGALYYCNMNCLSAEERSYRSNIGALIVYGYTTFYREWAKKK